MLGYGERWLRWEMMCDGKAIKRYGTAKMGYGEDQQRMALKGRWNGTKRRCVETVRQSAVRRSLEQATLGIGRAKKSIEKNRRREAWRGNDETQGRSIAR